MREADLARYDYSLCHGCGVVYAALRPERDEYARLLADFDENLGRPEDSASNPVVNDVRLTDHDRAELRHRLRHGWLVSEEDRPADWIPALLDDRMQHAPHLDLILSSTPPRGARVLEIRSSTGWLLDVLRRVLDAEVYAMPAFEVQQLIIDEVYGIPSGELVDFARFEIPYDGQFDLIISKHMFTHVLEPDRFFAVLRERLRPGGQVYLYVENDDLEIDARGKNLFGEMKCFHFQNFDLPSFARVLRRQGFEPRFVRHVSRASMAALAKVDPATAGTSIDPEELAERVARYRRWRDESVLSLPKRALSLFGDELELVERRALERGYARREPDGRVLPLRKLKLVHEAGYARINEQAQQA